MGVTNLCYWLSLACTITLVSASSHKFTFTRDNIRTELEPQLSQDANIYFPNASEFQVATQRWSPYHAPNFTVVVEVGVEEDVARAVQYANSQGVPFLAVNGGHGAISSLSDLTLGIEIWMHKLNSFAIATDGKTATVGGGTTSSGLMEKLWVAKKEAVHGVCECTSYLGPALGGGHGVLQGRYGLISDQFVSMNVVTADGEIRTVSQDDPAGDDLWWAMQGAGHNFGIVTSITLKIYDPPNDGLWTYESHVFRHDQVEDVFERFNQLAGIQPPGFLVWTSFLRNPALDAENPVINAVFVREGVSSIESEYMGPFRELSAESVNASGVYTDIPKWIGTDANSRGCIGQGTKVRFPIGLQRYDIPAQRKLFDAYAEGTAGSSPLNVSLVLLEQYSVQGVQAVPANSTAFPHRQDALLISPIVIYDSPETENQAREFGDGLREILLQGSGSDELHAYVNYASGYEGAESWYGYEPWRMERLKELKKKYDPESRFRYYAPIPVAN